LDEGLAFKWVLDECGGKASCFKVYENGFFIQEFSQMVLLSFPYYFIAIIIMKFVDRTMIL